MNDIIGLDFETYSGTDLTKHGLARYVQDPTFKPLIVAVAWGGYEVVRDFVLEDKNVVRDWLEETVAGNTVVAHNAGFEEAVLDWLDLAHLPSRYIDSAVIARTQGGSGSLMQATKQLLPFSKMEEGRDLIKLFSIPGKYQEENGSLEFDPRVVEDNGVSWSTFKGYCGVDAKAGRAIDAQYWTSAAELDYADITFRMNKVGWPVDRDVVEEMYARYLENQMAALEEFAVQHDAASLNLNSLKQMKAWCAERGIKASSFDEKHVEKLLVALHKKTTDMFSLDPNVTGDSQFQGYCAVIDLLKVKQVLGGSSLKKLKVILDTIAKDDEGVWRLKNQYIHCGAPQTWRTTGRSAQMQNLKRLDQSNLRDMYTVFDPDVVWTNEAMAENLRQVFTSRQDDGSLLVGDFKSIESRWLAYMADEHWKVNAYRSGADVYKELATQIYGVPYTKVTAEQRQTGKVGELSCGYGAAAPAVQSFAEGMGVLMNEAEANKLVNDWRSVNQITVAFWYQLDDAIHKALKTGGAQLLTRMGSFINLTMVPAPQSLVKMYPKAQTLQVTVTKPHTNKTYMTRTFHGAHESGRNVRYFKPSKKKSGEIWTNRFTDPKTKQIRFHEIYGGKLTGILTQSWCRELFMDQLQLVDQWVGVTPNLQLIGQFHDEIVIDWVPDANVSLQGAQLTLKDHMKDNVTFPDFPLDAEVKYAYRYIK